MFLFKLSQGVTIDPSFCSQKHLEGHLTELFLKTPKKTTIVNHTLIYLIFSIFHSSQKTLYFLVFHFLWLDIHYVVRVTHSHDQPSIAKASCVFIIFLYPWFEMTKS